MEKALPLSLDEVEHLHNHTTTIARLAQDVERLYAESKPGTRDRARCAFLMGAIQYDRAADEAARPFFQEMVPIAKKLKDEHLRADSLHGLAMLAFRKGDFKTSTRLQEEALQIALRIDYPVRVSNSYFALSLISAIFGLHESTLKNLRQALDIARRNQLIKLEILILNKLAELSMFSNDFPKAQKYYQNYLALVQRTGTPFERYKAKIRLALAELELGNLEKVLALIEEDNYPLPKSERSLWTQIHALRGKVFEAKRKWKEAEAELRKSLRSATYPYAERVRSNIHIHLAELYFQQKLYRKAITEGKKALEDAAKSMHESVTKDALRTLHNCHKALKEYKQAYKYLEEYNALVAKSDRDLLSSRLEFHELRLDFETERTKAEEGKRAAEVLRLELEHKERELTEKTKHLIQQAESLAQFREDLQAMLRRSPADDPLVRSIRTRLQEMPKPQLTWEDFEAQFKSVHPQFTQNITEAFPELTAMERKLCTLLRLNLTSEEIARLLFLSARNIENHRYRIRKKLGLTPTDSLQTLLAKY